MSRDELIAMAKEARISEMGLNIDGSIHLLGLFERFAALVAAKEREACAQIAEQTHPSDLPFIGGAIRARARASHDRS